MRFSRHFWSRHFNFRLSHQAHSSDAVPSDLAEFHVVALVWPPRHAFAQISEKTGTSVLDDIHKICFDQSSGSAALSVTYVCVPGLWNSGFEGLFYLFTLASKQNTMKDCWSGKWYKWWIESNEQPFVSFYSASYCWTLACKWQLDFSCSAKRTLALDQLETPSIDSAALTLEKSLQQNQLSDFSSWVHQPFPLHHLSTGKFTL